VSVGISEYLWGTAHPEGRIQRKAYKTVPHLELTKKETRRKYLAILYSWSYLKKATHWKWRAKKKKRRGDF